MSAIGRVLGVDYGEARIGLALSDKMRMVATPLETVDGKSQKLTTRRKQMRDQLAAQLILHS